MPKIHKFTNSLTHITAGALTTAEAGSDPGLPAAPGGEAGSASLLVTGLSTASEKRPHRH
jgi:hypothetical protein